MDSKDFDILTCELDPEISILLVNPDMVDEWKDRTAGCRFDQTHGFCIRGEGIDPLIVVDSRLLVQDWFTEDHFQVLVAHELGHIHQDTTDEQQADLYGIQLLEKHGLDAAAELHRELHAQRTHDGWYDTP